MNFHDHVRAWIDSVVADSRRKIDDEAARVLRIDPHRAVEDEWGRTIRLEARCPADPPHEGCVLCQGTGWVEAI